MNNIYALIIVSFLGSDKSNTLQIPYFKIISSHKSYNDCDKEIVKTHNYYLAKDIKRKKVKQRNPKFVYDARKNKMLLYKEKGVFYYASCKLIEVN